MASTSTPWSMTCPPYRRRSAPRSLPRGTPKEDLLDLLTTARAHPDREQICRLLYRFYRRCAEADVPELQRLATTVEVWWPQILAFLQAGITNAGSEGTIDCGAYDFRNPNNQRLRTRCATTRKARGHLNAR
ncbi:transposase [Micromonospora costi]|uniref:transposase n=1 Tax=Micromonospora costi TaxID=1530042 RepID=UPI00240E5C65|nr:transposase [Micromonospora costi]